MSRSIKPKSSIDKKIEACEKAVKEDSILGAYHKMVSCVADLLNQYAAVSYTHLYSVSNQRWFRFVTLPTETDAGSLVDFSLFMMEKGLRYHSCIKECQWTAVPVPFLEWGDPFCWNSSSKTFVVFCDTGMLLFMIVFIQIDCPETVQDVYKRQ